MAISLRARLALPPQGQFDLTASHGQIDLGQESGIKQGTVQIAARTVDLIALAQRIQGVALPGMTATGQDQAIEDRAEVSDARGLGPPLLQLMVEKSHVEGGVVDDELGTTDVGEKLLGDIGEARLVAEEGIGDAVDIEGTLLHVAIGLQVAMEVIARRPPLHQFDAANLDDAMAIAGFQAGGFRIKDDLTHGGIT